MIYLLVIVGYDSVHQFQLRPLRREAREEREAELRRRLAQLSEECKVPRRGMRGKRRWGVATQKWDGYELDIVMISWIRLLII